jgi:peptide/nickel transport system substrate-binding protein
MIARRRVLAAGAASLALPSLARAQGTGVVRFVPQSDLVLLDPIASPALVTRNHALLVFDTLYGVDETYQVQPQMVAGHVVEDDGKLWRLTLRAGLRFHDGEPVLARDAVASLQRWGRRDGFGGTLLSMTDALSAPDDRTIVFRLKQPFPLLPTALGKSGVNVPFIMPARLAAADPAKPVTEMVGSGPFRFVADERVQGSLVVYRRFDGYVPRPDGKASFMAGPKRALVERVEWRVTPDMATALSALQTGEVDWVEQPANDALDLLRRNRNITVEVLNTGGNYLVMRPNHLNPPFDDPGVRRAVMGAIAQADYVAVAAGEPGLGRTGVGYFHPDSPMASDAGMSALTGPRDLDAVKRALDAAGYKGQHGVMMTPGDAPVSAAITEVGADMFRRLGMDIDDQRMDFASLAARVISQEPLDRKGWSVICTFTDGANTFNPAAHTYLRGLGRASTLGWPTSPALEALRSRWLTAPSNDSPAIGREMQLQAFQDVPYWPLGLYLQPTAYRRSVTNVVKGAPIFYGLAKT